MLPKILSKALLFIAALIGTTLFLSFLIHFVRQSSAGSELAASHTSGAISSASSAQGKIGKIADGLLPARIKIPSINVDALVEYVGLTPSGAMDVSKSPADAMWFKLGPRPGENGSAVIAGHYGWKDNMPAVFDSLNKLSKGDKIYVENKKGTTSVFIVREIQIYGDNENPPFVFNSSDGKAHLNLITCEGDWNKEAKSYSGRLVVFADKK